MHLIKLRIANFRGIKEAALEFNPGVNVLIGENNACKTAVLDAIRICISYGNQRREIYISKADFHVDRSDPTKDVQDIEFDLTFRIDDPEEAGVFHELLAIAGEGQNLQLHFRYYLDERNGEQRVKYSVWGGENEGQRISPDQMDLFYFVYLGALRNAVQNLRPVRGNQLGQLYSKLETDPVQQKDLAGKVHNALQNHDEWQQLITSGKDRVNEHLAQTTFHGGEEQVHIDFLPFEFTRIVDNLRLQTPVYHESILKAHEGQEQAYFELYQNGLGYNNLIYTATVLGDLRRKRELRAEAYIALLIEEPEAHLHPQLQNTFFRYLNELNKMGFQTFVTSHSPTITAKADLESLIVLQKTGEVLQCFPLKSSDLTEVNCQFLRKFLDVTKSQLFFARGVILVEGISEALLLPVFSRIMGEEYDIERNGVEIVNINGVAFEHFAKLFNSEDQERRLQNRCAVITDDDQDDAGDESSRALKARQLAGGCLRVELAERTFEYELFKTGDNGELLLKLFEQLRPRARKSLQGGDTLEDAAREFQEKVATTRAKSCPAPLNLVQIWV